MPSLLCASLPRLLPCCVSAPFLPELVALQPPPPISSSWPHTGASLTVTCASRCSSFLSSFSFSRRMMRSCSSTLCYCFHLRSYFSTCIAANSKMSPVGSPFLQRDVSKSRCQKSVTFIRINNACFLELSGV